MFNESYEQILDMFKVIDRKLESPAEVAKEVEKKYIQQKLKVMKNIYDITEKFIIQNDGVLYGGYALNALLSTDMKFYDDLTLPDYDCFLLKPDSKSKELADILIKENYPYTEVKHALHENTYKVFSNFESVADFTGLGKNTIKVISETAETIHNKLKVCSKELLKAFAYLELCLPQGASYRWVKVYKRLLIFETAFPFNPKHNTNIVEQLHTYVLPEVEYSLYTKLKRFFKDEEVVFSGVYSLMEHLDCKVSKKQTKYIEILSIHPQKHLERVIEIIKEDPSATRKIVTNKEQSDIINVNVDIYMKNKDMRRYVKIMRIYDTSNNCYSYFDKSTKRISSIYFELYRMYMNRFLFNDTSNDVFIETLSKKLMSDDENMTFTDKCYGTTKSISAIKKSIWDNKKKIVFYRPK